MPRNYVKKTEYTPLDADKMFQMLKAIKMDNVPVLAVARDHGVTKDVAYRLSAAFDRNETTKNEPISEETLRAFVTTRSQKGHPKVSILQAFGKTKQR